MLLRRRSRLMTLNSSSWPRSDSRFLTGLMSTSEPGRNARRPDVHRQAALDPVGDPALDDPAVLVGPLHLGPAPHPQRLRVGQEHVPLEVLGLFEQDVDVLADLDAQLAATVGELLDGDQAFRLVPHVDDHSVGRDADNAPRHDLTLGEIAHAFVVQFEELAVLVRVPLLLGLRAVPGPEFFASRHRKTYLLGLGFRLSEPVLPTVVGMRVLLNSLRTRAFEYRAQGVGCQCGGIQLDRHPPAMNRRARNGAL